MATRRKSAEERREEVLDVAMARFAEGGYAGTSTETIAREAGISHPYLFRLFRTKKELFLACDDRACEKILVAFRRAAASVEPGHKLDAMGEAYVEELLTDRHARRPRGSGCYVRRMARDPDEDYDDEDDLSEDDGDEEGPEVGVTVEIVGLSLYTHHGVSAAEREIGQRLVLDVRFDVGEPDALITDRVEDTVDYGEVCQVIALIAQQRSYKTLERLCAVIADRLASQFGAESVTVKASKPEPPIPLPVEEVSVEVWREER